jgi:hypothetical protein
MRLSNLLLVAPFVVGCATDPSDAGDDPNDQEVAYAGKADGLSQLSGTFDISKYQTVAPTPSSTDCTEATFKTVTFDAKSFHYTWGTYSDDYDGHFSALLMPCTYKGHVTSSYRITGGAYQLTDSPETGLPLLELSRRPTQTGGAYPFLGEYDLHFYKSGGIKILGIKYYKPA